MILATRYRLAGDRALARVNREVGPRIEGHIRIAPWHRHVHCVRNVERGLELIPLGLLVDRMRCPLYVSRVGGKFAHYLAGSVEAVDSETSALPFQSALWIAIEPGG